MAKLTGVQTIDMVNGEITKVSYNGEEYAKVSGQAQAGDIGVITTGWGSQQVGDYYEIMRISESCGRTYSHINGRVCNANGYVDNFEYFRKISEKSTISAKLDEIDARVTALEKAEEPKAEPLKVGDYAKVLVKENSYNGFHEVGAIVGITKVDGDSSNVPYQAVGLDGKESRWFKAKHIVKATDEEVAEAKALAGQSAKDAIFTQAGRKPNEYRKGDIITGYAMHRGETVVGEIKDIGETVMGVVDAKGYTAVNDFHPIVFVESRLDK